MSTTRSYRGPWVGPDFFNILIFGSLLTVLLLLRLSSVSAQAVGTGEHEFPGHVIDHAEVLTDPDAIEQAATSAEGEYDLYVLTVDGPYVAADNYDADVQQFLQDNPDLGEFQSEDGLLRDDAVLITISPQVRQLGAYAGDNVDIERGGVADITDAMTSPAQDGDWDQTALSGIDAAGKSLKAPAGHPDTAASSSDSWAAGLIQTLYLGAALAAGVGATVLLIKLNTHRSSNTPPKKEDVLHGREQLTELSKRVEGADVPEWLAYDIRTALETIEQFSEPDGTVQRGRAASVFGDTVAHWRLERLRGEVDYFLQADGSGWEERWADKQRLAVGGQIDRARESAEKLLQEEGSRRLGKKALRIARQAQAQVIRIDSGVRDKRITPRSGEAQTHEALAKLRGRADLFRDRHKGSLPSTTDPTSHRDTEWFMPVLVSAWAGANLANSIRNSSPSTTPTFGSAGGFSGGSTGF